MPSPEPPNLDDWLAYCNSCATNQPVRRAEEQDMKTGETYYEFVCMECHTVALTIVAANPGERDQRPPMSTRD